VLQGSLAARGLVGKHATDLDECHHLTQETRTRPGTRQR
jgi:hypothetical protein